MQALDAHLVAEAHRPFDLAAGPLLRVSLFRRSPREHILLLVVHHIVADLWSLAVLARELGALYAAESRGEVPCSPRCRCRTPSMSPARPHC